MFSYNPAKENKDQDLNSSSDLGILTLTEKRG